MGPESSPGHKYDIGSFASFLNALQPSALMPAGHPVVPPGGNHCADIQSLHQSHRRLSIPRHGHDQQTSAFTVAEPGVWLAVPPAITLTRQLYFFFKCGINTSNKPDQEWKW